jgi:hypothetical protein
VVIAIFRTIPLSIQLVLLRWAQFSVNDQSVITLSMTWPWRDHWLNSRKNPVGPVYFTMLIRDSRTSKAPAAI